MGCKVSESIAVKTWLFDRLFKDYLDYRVIIDNSKENYIIRDSVKFIQITVDLYAQSADGQALIHISYDYNNYDGPEYEDAIHLFKRGLTVFRKLLAEEVSGNEI